MAKKHKRRSTIHAGVKRRGHRRDEGVPYDHILRMVKLHTEEPWHSYREITSILFDEVGEMYLPGQIQSLVRREIRAEGWVPGMRLDAESS